MKKLFLILSMIGLISTPVLAEETKQPIKPIEQHVNTALPSKEVISIGLPLNTSGITIEGRPDTLKFISIDSNSKIKIDWDNVCKIATQHQFALTDLQKLNGNDFLTFIMPYIIQEANNGQHKC